MLICGADPGLDGALAFLDPASQRITAMIGMPALKLAKGKGSKREIQARTLVVMVEEALPIWSPEMPPVQVFLECVSSSPQMGNVSAFQFGRWYGYIEMLAAAWGWPVEYPTPTEWKRALKVRAEKDDARSRACQLMPRDVALWTPQRNVFDSKQAAGRAEAALIALFGARKLGLVNGQLLVS
jgi:crossover junction endodeoxyribonuclease RuvC